jgi:hypothetical protein
MILSTRRKDRQGVRSEWDPYVVLDGAHRYIGEIMLLYFYSIWGSVRPVGSHAREPQGQRSQHVQDQ